LFVSALALRLIVLALLAPQRAATGGNAWDFGHEEACLGQSIWLGHGLSDPWGHGTGPSAWLTPPYPALLAALMWMFDGVNPPLALTLFVIQAVASAATCVMLVQLGKNLGARAAGWWGGALFAIYPPSIWNAVNVVWDTTFVAFGTVLCLVALTRADALARTSRVVGLGLSWGALVLLNPAPLALLPAVIGYIAMRERPWLRTAGMFLAGIFAVCAPWMIRNAFVLGTANLRPNFGVEMRLGNNPESNGHPQPFRFHPSHVPEELALYKELGEKRYAANCMSRALDWIRAEPGSFSVLCLRRIQYFWLGDLPLADERTSKNARAPFDPNAWAKFVAYAAFGVLGWIGVLRWKGPRRDRVLLIGSLACFGLAYYVTHVSERYRFPIDPLLALLSASALLAFLARVRPKNLAP
jgi:4-amino-4-deoxy-L-arabinose transferase-like glycosyltransferase